MSTAVYKLSELAEQTNATIIGDSELMIDGTVGLDELSSRKIAFSNEAKNKPPQGIQDAAVVSQHKDYNSNIEGISVLLSDKPYLAFAYISQLFKQRPLAQGIHPNAIVHPTAKVGNAHIGANSIVDENCRIEDDVYIGANCQILAGSIIKKNTYLVTNCTICKDSIIGERCIIHPGVVIGSDGFGFAETPDSKWVKIEQQGNVIIGDDVEIGANTTIDRATFESTIIEDGVKIDNQVMVAHNVTIGAHTAIAGCVGIAGSTKIGKYCKIAGQVGINGHIEICDKVTILGQAMVIKSISKPGVYAGAPCQDYNTAIKNMTLYRNLHKILNKKD